MKKLSSLVLLLVLALTGFAQEVDLDLATKVATNFFNDTYSAGYKVKDSVIAVSKNKKMHKSFTKQYKGHNSFHVLNMGNGGWVIVSSHKALGPILAYSPTGTIDENNQPQVFIDWMKQYEVRIDSAYIKNSHNDEKDKKWNEYEKGNTSKLKSTRTATGFYLLDTEWGQSGNAYIPEGQNSYQQVDYNLLMPYNCDVLGTLIRSPVGCVATAMGQIMNYWKFSKGCEADFEWWNMPDKFHVPQNASNAVSYLLKRCGDRVGMEYGCSSSADAYNCINAFLNFGYQVDDYKRSFWHTYNAWVDILKNELDNNRPILYRYVGKHAFVCDGYKYGTHTFHFNFGWDGYQDNWYDFEDISKADASFSDADNHHCIVGIRPYNLDLKELKDISIYVSSKDECKSKQTYQAKTISMAGDNTYFTVASGADCHAIASQKITLRPGFKAISGGTFLARIVSNGNLLKSKTLISDNTSENKSLDNTTIKKDDSNDFVVYPNPSTIGSISIVAKNPIQTAVKLEIYDMLGHKVRNTQYDSFSKQQISLEDLSQGVYFLKLLYGEKTYNCKFIKN